VKYSSKAFLNWNEITIAKTKKEKAIIKEEVAIIILNDDKLVDNLKANCEGM
jgi:hypothetical protein